MNERIHRHLDGELAWQELTDAERAELEAYEAAISETVSQQRFEDVDVASAVMERVGHGRRVRPRRRLTDWIWQPVTVRLRPAFALVLLVLLALPWLRPTGGESGARQVLVHFRLDAPEASRVQLAGDFTGWQPSYTLHEMVPGVWSLVVPLDAGVHDYAFVIDGERWIADPLAPGVDDGFGGRNSRLTVLAPATRASS